MAEQTTETRVTIYKKDLLKIKNEFKKLRTDETNLRLGCNIKV